MKRRNFFGKLRMGISGFWGVNSLEAQSQNLNSNLKRLTSSPLSIATWNCPQKLWKKLLM